MKSTYPVKCYTTCLPLVVEAVWPHHSSQGHSICQVLLRSSQESSEWTQMLPSTSRLLSLTFLPVWVMVLSWASRSLKIPGPFLLELCTTARDPEISCMLISNKEHLPLSLSDIWPQVFLLLLFERKEKLEGHYFSHRNWTFFNYTNVSNKGLVPERNEMIDLRVSKILLGREMSRSFKSVLWN